jgi:hypothetical protein
LNETKFWEFSTLSEKQIEGLDSVLNSDIPNLMAQLPSEKDTPESLRVKMGRMNNQANVPVPVAGNKFGKKDTVNDSNPFGYDEKDEENFWYVSCRCLVQTENLFSHCHWRGLYLIILLDFYEYLTIVLQGITRLSGSFTQ